MLARSGACSTKECDSAQVAGQFEYAGALDSDDEDDEDDGKIINVRTDFLDEKARRTPYRCRWPHRTALHRTALHRTALHRTALHCTAVPSCGAGAGRAP